MGAANPQASEPSPLASPKNTEIRMCLFDPTKNTFDEGYEAKLQRDLKEIHELELETNVLSSGSTEYQTRQSQTPVSSRPSAEPAQEQGSTISESGSSTCAPPEDTELDLPVNTGVGEKPTPATQTTAAPSLTKDRNWLTQEFTRWEECTRARSKEKQDDSAIDARDFDDRITEEELALIAQRDIATKEIAAGYVPHLATIGREPWIGCEWPSHCFGGRGTYAFSEDPEVLALIISCAAPGQGFEFGDFITPAGTGRNVAKMMGGLMEELHCWSNERASNKYLYPKTSSEDVDWERYGEHPSTDLTRGGERERMVWFWRGFVLVREIYRRFRRHAEIDWEAVGVKRLRVAWDPPAFGWPDYSGHGEELWFPARGPHLGVLELVESDRVPVRETRIYKFIADYHPEYLFLEDGRIRQVLGMEDE